MKTVRSVAAGIFVRINIVKKIKVKRWLTIKVSYFEKRIAIATF